MYSLGRKIGLSCEMGHLLIGPPKEQEVQFDPNVHSEY